MHIELNTAVASKVLKQLEKVLPKRVSMPILHNIMLEAKDDKLSMEATNLDFTLKIRIPCVVKEEGVCLLPKQAIQIISNLDGMVTLKQDDEQHITIEGKNAKYKMTLQPDEDYPKFKKEDLDKTPVLIPKEALMGILKVVPFAGKTDPRPFLNGINVEIADDGLHFVASDAYTLGHYFVKGEFNTQWSGIIPKEIVDILVSLEGDTLYLYKGSTAIAVGSEDKNSWVLTRLIQGPYAPWREVMPKEDGFVLTIDVNETKQAIKRIASISPEGTNSVYLHISTNEVTLTVDSQYGEAKEILNGKYDGDPMTICFDAKLLLRAINQVEGEAKIHLYDPRQAVMIEGQDNGEYLVMPQKIE